MSFNSNRETIHLNVIELLTEARRDLFDQVVLNSAINPLKLKVLNLLSKVMNLKAKNGTEIGNYLKIF